MRPSAITSVLCLALLAVAAPRAAQEEAESYDEYSTWLGGHYSEFLNDGKKAGEYRIIEDDGWAEVRLRLLSRRGNSLLTANGHFFDKDNLQARMSLVNGRTLDLDFGCRTLIHQLGQDRLLDFAAREWAAGADTLGGKMLTHTILDSLVDCHVSRREMLTRIDLQL
ncbi:MAG TPA: hypothetical protein PLR32_04780 [candidate division Zixibacteria bacterium]|nr:hypothetical protein [candidate division Zixibacteria bacterium]MDD4917561.1 hypothetical protein [candidate division Zixibacteria bacterium]MDM7972170.1 hypothetical protein [candidate division Zixibacteria bacterium]HOD66466.1 hypothetical protein [candidate division Zixibacteria bacterium]HOZ06760.1 hypothetical protein [candidate division Zixibacteria bacterium]